MRSHRCSSPQECEFYLAEEVSLLLPGGKAGQVAADHQVRVVQDRVEPTPGGQQSLDAGGTGLYLVNKIKNINHFIK